MSHLQRLFTLVLLSLFLVSPVGTVSAQTKPQSTTPKLATALVLEESEENPDPALLEVSANTASENFTVFVFNVFNDSEDEVEITSATIATKISGIVPTQSVIESAVLVYNRGEEEFRGTIQNKDDGSIVFSGLDDVYIQDGDTEEFELQVTFSPVKGKYAMGSTIQFGINSGGLQAKGIKKSAISGSVSSERHTLSSTGIFLEPVSTSAFAIGTSSAGSYGNYTIKFDVTGIGSDIRIPRTAESLTSGKAAGVLYTLSGDTFTPTYEGTSFSTLTSTADMKGPDYIVKKGDTETFTLTVIATPTKSGNYASALSQVRFTSNISSSTETYALSASQASDFTTKRVLITASSSKPATGVDTYRGYKNGSMFIETKGITEANALANCTQNALTNPLASIRCTWGTKEIYRREASKAPSSTSTTTPAVQPTVPKGKPEVLPPAPTTKTTPVVPPVLPTLPKTKPVAPEVLPPAPPTKTTPVVPPVQPTLPKTKPVAPATVEPVVPAKPLFFDRNNMTSLEAGALSGFEKALNAILQSLVK